MKITLFANVNDLKVGDQVAGPSALTDMRLFCKLGTPLYEVVSIVDWHFGWWKWHYAKIKRLSDGEVLKIDLNQPSGFFERSAPVDLRKDWAQISQD